MNVVIIGSGGREHALAYKISESRLLEKLYIIPGNPGTKLLGENVTIDYGNMEAVISFCKEKNIQLVVIGPEKPLMDGLADKLREEKIKVFGPDAKAAAIEGHKSFAKTFMKRNNIPTADYAEFDSSMFEQTLKYLLNQKYPLVIKADGLAAGKGVAICSSFEESKLIVEDYFVKKIFGNAGEKIIIEEFMEGYEVSLFAITDGKDYICLPVSQDHKKIGENDTGKNTGGMGAYTPVPFLSEEELKVIEEIIIIPAINGLRNEGKKFIGCLYAGLMITSEGPKVVEFNCRFGDPETQAVLPLIDGDFLKLLYSAADENLDKKSIEYNGASGVTVVVSSGGYPDLFEKGFTIEGLDAIQDLNVMVFHAGTSESEGQIITNGGRVLALTSVNRDGNLKAAIENVYTALKKINFEGMYYRKDIALKGLK